VWQPVRTDTRPPEICTNPAQCGLVLDAVRRRIAAREAKDFALADALRAELMATGIELEDLRDEQTTMWRQLGPDADRPTKDESVRRRSLHHIVRDALADAEPTARAALEATSVAQLAQAAAAVVCEMDVYCPGAPLDARRCADALAAAACARIAKCGAPEMHGRKAADAAFSFAIAGVLDMRVYAELADLLDAEIQRLATSMDASVALALTEKLAVAGVPRAHPVFARAATLVRLRLEAAERTAAPAPEKPIARHADSSSSRLVVSGALELFDERPLLWLWRHSARQRKRKQADASVAPGAAASGQLESALPCVGGRMPVLVDLGCGYGVSALGFASEARDRSSGAADCAAARGEAAGPAWARELLAARPFVLGCDLSSGAIAYAASMAERLDLGAHVRFATATAEEGLAWAVSERGAAADGALGVLVQFPTPFRSEDDADDVDGESADDADGAQAPAADGYRGNTQLPDREAFMLNEGLMRAAVDAVASRRAGGGSFLYVTTQVEDVAVEVRAQIERLSRGRLRALAEEELSLDAEPELPAREGADEDSNPRLRATTQRQAKYIARGGLRADGPGWLTRSPFPRRARTETEVCCAVDRKQAVYRILFVPCGEAGEAGAEASVRGHVREADDTHGDMPTTGSESAERAAKHPKR
jgi:SAM-dependent methyltransferase